MFIVMDTRNMYYAQSRLGDGVVISWWSRWRRDAKSFSNALDAYDISNLEGAGRTRVIEVLT